MCKQDFQHSMVLRTQFLAYHWRKEEVKALQPLHPQHSTLGAELFECDKAHQPGNRWF